MSGDPDPKGGARRTIVDPAALRRFRLGHRTCVACGEPGSNAAHVLARGDGGDDVAENLVALCGSGTSGCHGAYHGSPYVATVVVVMPSTRSHEMTERRDREWVSIRIGAHLARERPDVIAYVLDKLGRRAGGHYLESRYGVSPAAFGLLSRHA